MLHGWDFLELGEEYKASAGVSTGVHHGKSKQYARADCNSLTAFSLWKWKGAYSKHEAQPTLLNSRECNSLLQSLRKLFQQILPEAFRIPIHSTTATADALKVPRGFQILKVSGGGYQRVATIPLHGNLVEQTSAAQTKSRDRNRTKPFSIVFHLIRSLVSRCFPIFAVSQ